MPVSINNTQIVFNDATTQTTAFTGSGNVQFSLALRTSAVNSKDTPLVYSGTAGTLTFTAPTGVTRVKVTVYGGGGAGGAGASDGSGGQNVGGSGGAGGYAKGIYTVVAGTAYTVTVGVGGTANGGAGGTSSFTTLISATGGGGGTNASILGNGNPGASGTGSSGNFRNTTGNGNDIYSGGGAPGGTTAAQIWNASSVYGAGGDGEGGEFTAGGGGVSGMVLIEYVG
jgi:hypothetical protein